MCTITATEFKKNFGKYAEISHKEGLTVTKNGKIYFSTNPPKCDPLEKFLEDCTGIIKEEDLDMDDPRIAGMLRKLWNY